MSTTSGSRRDQVGAASDPVATGLRDMILQAVTAYELAVATQARVAAEAARQHKQRRKDLGAQEAADSAQREESLRARHVSAEAEAERVSTLSALASELTESANNLLERAALAHVRGFGPGSADVGPHLASDEQVATAFAAAQTASVNMRALLLRVAQECLGSGDWQRAIEVAASLTAGAPGELASEAETVVRGASLGWVRELLSRGDQEIARAKADAWLGAHPQDAAMSGLLLEAAVGLAEQAEASGVQLDADSEVTAVIRQYRADDSRLRELVRRHPQVAWRVGGARLLGEFGIHQYPVRALALTADGNRLVSADDAEILVWDIVTGTDRNPVQKVPVAGTRGLSPDGALVLGKDGTLCRTGDPSQISEVGAIAAYAFSHDSSLLAWAARARKAWRFSQHQLAYSSSYSGPSLVEALGISDYQANAIREEAAYAMPAYHDSPIESARIGDAVSVSQDAYGSPVYTARFISSLQIADVTSGQQIRTIDLDLSHVFVDIAVSASSRKLAMLDPLGQVLVADIDSGALVPVFAVYTAQPTARSSAQPQAQSLLNPIAFSPGGDLVLVARAGRPATPAGPAVNKTAMTIWDVSRGDVLWHWETNRREGAVAFSPDGRLVATLAMDGTVSLFDVRAKQALPELGGNRFHGALTSPCLAFSPDGSRLAASGYRDVKVWGL